MHRYFILLSYNGKGYVGWQIQPNGLSVQEVLQKSLSIILREDISIVGAGRTDAGVHAKKMYAHFDISHKLDNCVELVRRINNFLPKDISIEYIKIVNNDAHARFTAESRTYKYYVTCKKDAFMYDFKHRVYYTLDTDKMNDMCKVIMEYKDFTSFSKLHTDVKTNICHIREAYWEKDGDDYVFTITANRFLRNMVRAIVGTLLEVGKGKLSENELRKILDQKDRSKAGESAPGHALYLYDVEYPDSIWI